jgi:hypothetical protein
MGYKFILMVMDLYDKQNVNKKERGPLQLMKATVLAESYDILSICIVICLLQRCLLTVAR